MPGVSDATAGHTAYAQLVGARNRIAELQASDPSAFQSLERLHQVTARLVNLVEDADPWLVSTNLLDLMTPTVTHMAAAVEALAQSGEATQLAAAEDSMDQLIAVVGWPLAYSFKKANGMRQSAGAYRTAVDQYLRGIQGKVVALSDRASEIDAQVTQTNATLAAAASDGAGRLAVSTADAETRIGTVVTTATSAVVEAAATATADVNEAVAAAKAGLATLVAAVEANKTRLDTLTAGYNTSFLEEQTARAARSDQSLTDEQAKHEAIRIQAQQALTEAMSVWTGSAQTTLATLADLEQQARDVVGVTSTVAITTGYHKYADEERRTANLWRRLAVIFLLAAVAWSAVFVALTASSKFDWSDLILKVLVSVPLFALAAYAVEQSGRHRTSERGARESELQLAAIDPYLARLGVEKRNEIKAEVALKLFAKTEADRAHPDGKPDIVDRLMEVVQLLAKR
jgi:hypothetical protein